MQPCVMAMGLGSAEEPASFSAVHGMDESGHSTGHAVERSCNHCPPSVTQAGHPCGDGGDSAGQCYEIPDYKLGERFSKLDSQDEFEFVAIVGLLSSQGMAIAVHDCLPLSISRPIDHIGPSLSLRFCVFLK